MSELQDQMEIPVRICSLFPRHMNLYGERGNLLVLERRLSEMGCTPYIDIYEGGPAPDWSDYDLLYLGSGTERAQKEVLRLLSGQEKKLADYVGSGRIFLATGTGAEILGTELITRDGEKLSGLGLGGFRVKQTDRRILGDVTVNFLGESMAPLIGFINCCGVIEQADTPFGEVLFGRQRSNDGRTPGEGYMRNRLFATRMIGPLLVRNPQFLEQLVFWLGEDKGVTPNDPDRKSPPWLAYQNSMAGLEERRMMKGEKD